VKLPANLRLGVCSHTGLVRTNNEDDYLLGALLAPGTLFAGVADGMGGMAGGAEASRTALRAAAQGVLDGQGRQNLAQRLRDGFSLAARRVHEASLALPALREMGTTMTAIGIADGTVEVAHIGDTRLYRRRHGRCEQLTVDHAVREPDNLLTRCIGAGQATAEPDVASFAATPGDRLLLVSDGVWSVLSPAGLLRAVEAADAQRCAEDLVAAALAAGGPDNATAVVVDVLAATGEGTVEQELPRDERTNARGGWPRAVSLRPPLWPWLLAAAGALLLVHGSLRWAGVVNGLAVLWRG